MQNYSKSWNLECKSAQLTLSALKILIFQDYHFTNPLADLNKYFARRWWTIGGDGGLLLGDGGLLLGDGGP